MLLGKSADELGRLKDSDNGAFQKIFEEATFKWYIFRLRVNMENYNVSPDYNLNMLILKPLFTFFYEQDENRLKTNVYEAREINFKEYNEKLIREIKEMVALE